MYMRSTASGYRRRYRPGFGGLGAASLFDTTPASSGHGSCSAAYWNWNPFALLDSDCKTNPLPAPPVPPPPGVVLTIGAQPTPDAVYSGTDQSGNTVWASSPAPDSTWASYKQSLQAFYGGLDNQNALACAAKGWEWDGSGACVKPLTVWDKYGSLMLAGGALLGGVVLLKAVTR